MKKLLVLLIIFSIALLTYGCGTVTVQAPVMPYMPVVSMEEPATSSSMFIPPAPMNINFIEKNGKETQTKDNVSVRIASIVDRIDNDKYTTKIEGPDGRSYRYSIFPMMLVLEITNNTDHIIRLERTIIQIEDENQIEYPLFSSFEENKRWLSGKISKAFDKYMEESLTNINTSEIEREYLDKYKSTVYSSYKKDYERMVKEVKEVKADFTKEGVRTPDMKPGYHLTEQGVQNLFEKYSPDTVYFQGSSQIKQKVQSAAYQVQAKINQKRVEINNLKNKAVQQIMSIPPISGLITNGEYPPISILPGRTKKIIAPISKRFKEEDIKSILVGIFDLPTKVNEAGIPTKRTNFNFHMIAERI